MMLSAKLYPYMSWSEALSNLDFDKSKIDLLNLPIDQSWQKIFKSSETLFENVVDRIIEDSKEHRVVFPYPDFLFKAFETPISKVRVVIIGQDPYHNDEFVDSNLIPQAMGLSFSVPVGLKIPSSLMNIYTNLVQYNHLRKKPSHGNLEKLQGQGVLLLNSSLSVMKNAPNSHQYLWKSFTNKIIQALDSPDVTFVLWGKDAIEKKAFLSKSITICSSHPSGLSCRKQCGMYPAFMNSDFAKNLGVDWNVLLE